MNALVTQSFLLVDLRS